METIDQQPLQQFTHLELIAKQVVEGFITGLHKSPFHGFSVEFAEHRLYNKGESTKHIDWKLYGRTDKLFVKRYEEETNLRCHLILDTSSSMYYPIVENKAFSFGEKKGHVNKITFSAYCAAALIELLKRQRDAVGLSIFSDKVELHTAAKSSSLHQKLLFRELEKCIQPQDLKAHKGTAVIEALHEISDAIHKRSKHNKHEVIVFHVTDKQKELDFDFDNRPYRFVDLETGEEIKLHPNELKEHYLAQMAAYKKELMLKCGQNKIEFIEADINLGFDQVLMPYLIKRTKMM
jgi:uncharacterized protein (DUF58 family)